jgi:hypothetical protein
MHDIDRMRRLKAIMDGNRARAGPTADIRPASGMVGQDCEGYVPDAGASRQIRVAVRRTIDEDIGPGSYDPEVPLLSHVPRLFPHDRETDLANRSVKPGPVEHQRRPKSTKLIHNLIPSPPYPRPEPPHDGDLTHPSWLRQPPKLVPHATHPETKFRPGIQTPQFLSESRRVLWCTRFTAPSPVMHAWQQPFITGLDNESSVPFKSRVDRFALPGPFPPPSTAYTISDLFGTSPTKGLHKLSTRKPREPAVTPDGTQYAAEIITRPNPERHSPAFMHVIDRFADGPFRSPAATEYTIDRDITAHTHKPAVHTREPFPAVEWDVLPQRQSPGVGSYDTPTPPISHGYISQLGRTSHDVKEDRPLGFRTLHSSLIRRSYNMKYYSPPRESPAVSFQNK